MKIASQPPVPRRRTDKTPPLEDREEARVRAARQAFREFHAQCFWYLRADLEITSAEVPIVAEGLRRNGGRAGFLLAAELCR